MPNKRDQFSDDEIGGGGNMTFKTTSKSPKTTGEGTAWRDDSDDSTDDNNAFHDRIRSASRNAG